MFGWFKKKDDQSDSPKKETASQTTLQRLKERLAKTRDSFVHKMDALFLGKKVINGELLDELEEVLITADLGYGVTMSLVDKARKMVSRDELSDPQALKNLIKENILADLQNAAIGHDAVMPADGPMVTMVVGVNGVGKTTTIGKLSHMFVKENKKVLLIAADTFRAAAMDQLKAWGKKIGVEVWAPSSETDPSAVVFDGLDYAASRQFDVIIIDTAGRLHTKVNLMEELKKIKRVTGKKHPGAPHETLLVLDATTGQNALSQARLFNEAVEVTGLILTKLDGTAKGGIVINICHEFNIPVRFIGIGEKMEDLRPFNPSDFVEALFAENFS